MGNARWEKVCLAVMRKRMSQKTAFHRHYDAAISSLARLHIIMNPSSKLTLNSTFKAAFRMAITGEYVHTSDVSNIRPKRDMMVVENIEVLAFLQGKMKNDLQALMFWMHTP